MKKAKGFISRRKLQKEMIKIIEQHNGNNMFDSGACSSINVLADRLNIDIIINRFLRS